MNYLSTERLSQVIWEPQVSLVLWENSGLWNMLLTGSHRNSESGVFVYLQLQSRLDTRLLLFLLLLLSRFSCVQLYATP